MNKPKTGGLAAFASPSRSPTPAPGPAAAPTPDSQTTPIEASPVGRGRPRATPVGEVVPVSIRMRADQRRAVRQYALDTDQTVQTLVLDAIAEAIKKGGGKWPA